jgi:hypothetical protein
MMTRVNKSILERERILRVLNNRKNKVLKQKEQDQTDQIYRLRQTKSRLHVYD